MSMVKCPVTCDRPTMTTLTDFREFVSERLTSAADEIFGVFEKAVMEYEKEIHRQRKLLETAWTPEVKLHKIGLQPDVEEKEEFVSELQPLYNQESSSTLDREDPEPPQMKEEPGTSQLNVKEEQDAYVLISTHCELDSGSGEAQSPAMERHFMAPEPNVDKQLLLHGSSAVENQDYYGAEHGESCSNLIQEQYSDHTELVPIMSKMNNNFMSTACTSGFHTSDGVRRFMDVELEHMMGHTADKLYSCKTCEKHFRNYNEMERHTRTHTGERPYACSVCGKAFIDSFSLTRHMRVHTGEKPYSCTTCGKRFRHTSNLSVHMRIHTGVRAYPCNVCGKRFNTSTQVKMHIRTHTGDRPYVCITCGKRFIQKSTLRRHMVIHTGENPYSCTACHKRFNHRSSLTRHMRIHMDERDYSCRIVEEGIQ